MPADHFDAALEATDYVLFAPLYPQAGRPGAEFVRDRVHAYAQAGLRGTVVEYGRPGPRSATAEGGRITVLNATEAEAFNWAKRTGARRLPLLAHSPTPAMQHQLHSEVSPGRTAVWFHGYEVRDYRRLDSNFTTQDLAIRSGLLDATNQARFAAAAPLFTNPGVVKVFISEFQRRLAQFDVGATAVNSRVIPNQIDTDLFRARVRTPDEARSVLLMRLFGARNYGNDIAIRALGIVSRRADFGTLRVTVRGSGVLFGSEVRPLRRFANIEIIEGHLSRPEMAAHHFDHGVFLCPTRFDTQGVMLGEAMSSGMVTITNPVAAIPEFTDERSSLLPRGNDPIAFANALSYLIDNPSLMPKLSATAAARVAEQCGRAATLGRELALIRELSA